MSLEQKRRIHLVDAIAVIDDPYQLYAGFLDEHQDLICVCIEGILNQLLDDGARALHHFTCGYFVMYLWIKPSDRRHLIPRLLMIGRTHVSTQVTCPPRMPISA